MLVENHNARIDQFKLDVTDILYVHELRLSKKFRYSIELPAIFEQTQYDKNFLSVPSAYSFNIILRCEGISCSEFLMPPNTILRLNGKA